MKRQVSERERSGRNIPGERSVARICLGTSRALRPGVSSLTPLSTPCSGGMLRPVGNPAGADARVHALMMTSVLKLKPESEIRFSYFTHIFLQELHSEV